jgi:hypothetical protein
VRHNGVKVPKKVLFAGISASANMCGPAGSWKPGVCSPFAQFFHFVGSLRESSTLYTAEVTHVQDSNRQQANPCASHPPVDLCRL